MVSDSFTSSFISESGLKLTSPRSDIVVAYVRWFPSSKKWHDSWFMISLKRNRWGTSLLVTKIIYALETSSTIANLFVVLSSLWRRVIFFTRYDENHVSGPDRGHPESFDHTGILSVDLRRGSRVTETQLFTPPPWKHEMREVAFTPEEPKGAWVCAVLKSERWD